MNQTVGPTSLPPQDQPPAGRGGNRLVDRLAQWFSIGVSLTVLGFVAWKLRDIDLQALVAMLPRSPLFWAVFAVTYMITPVADWIIFRRLWRLQPAGMAALIRKLVSNELLLGYLGEAQFYGWAKARLSQVSAPFGAVKDVAILSAVTGNLITLVLLVCAWPLVSSGQLGVATRDAYASLGVVLLTSFAILLFRRTLFSLPKSDLWFISLVQVGRTLGFLVGSALMWHLVLKGIPVSLWIVLATLRMLVSRLPLLPNKDLVFAGLTVFLMGHQQQVADLMALMTLLLLAAHLLMGTIFGIVGLFETEKAE